MRTKSFIPLCAVLFGLAAAGGPDVSAQILNTRLLSNLPLGAGNGEVWAEGN